MAWLQRRCHAAFTPVVPIPFYSRVLPAAAAVERLENRHHTGTAEATPPFYGERMVYGSCLE